MKTQPKADAPAAEVTPHVTTPVVGIGASAGGLAAFEAFFSGMPEDVASGLAFVLVQHLAPDHKSLLTEIIRRYTSMQVFEVEDGMKVEPNCAYIIPPNRDMAYLDGKLQLIEPAAPRGQRMPIDFFFRSLALGLNEVAIGVVLSGTGSDGTLGIRAIKKAGGMVIAQTPASCEYDGMPRNAIATGLVDYDLPPSEMAAQIFTYVARTVSSPLHTAPAPKLINDDALHTIFIMLHARTGHDFSQYKPSTIQRRIERRMALNQIATQDDYIRYLQQNATETDALFRDLLIGVTGFFRDPDAFTALEKEVIPRLFANKPSGSLVRIWSTGCSSGEEAYSFAILMQEHLERVRERYVVQIFATDIDSNAIATARSGLYPASIAEDISPERLARFFTAEAEGNAYHVHKTIRDMLVFSEQNVIKDPPFSKLDCIVCRNLLIYMGGDLQRKLIPLFHYALNPGGFLFLGTSETVGDFGDLFTTIDRKLKLYQRKDTLHDRHHVAMGRFLPPRPTIETPYPRSAIKEIDTAKLPLRELTEQALLKQFAPAGVLVNARGDILYFHGRTGQYLEPSPGEAGVSNILKMAREGLRRGLSTTLHKAHSTGKTHRNKGLRIKSNSGFISVNITACPVTAGSIAHGFPMYLVILEAAPQSEPDTAQTAGPAETGGHIDGLPINRDVDIEILRQELLAKEEYLQTAIEELETSNEELKSSNEEMQAINEELQSSNEELETSKEELQSVNEELATVNAELQNKLADLSQTNNDMSNLLSGTGIATVFVDLQLRLLRFTPAATRIINLIQVDIGRPVGHIASNMVGYTSMVADVQSVLETLVPKELDVRTEEGKWYTMRIQPYRTIENVIEGAVITFVDITEMKKSHELLQEAHDQLRLVGVVRDSQDAIAALNMRGDIISWNPSAQRLFGWSEEEALTMNIQEMTAEENREHELETIRSVAAGSMVQYETIRLNKEGQSIPILLTATFLVNNSGSIYAMAVTQRVTQGRIQA